MKKSVKKGLLITGGIFAFLFVSLLAAPFLFKDQIKAKIDSELAKTVNATILYNADKFSLSLIRNFPNASISIGDFILIGKKEEFKGDTLFKADDMHFSADIMSVIAGDKIKIVGVSLNKPLIVTKFAKNGALSWDIMYPSADTTTKTEEPSKFNISVEKWEIIDGRIIYDDRTMPMYAEVLHLDHSGSGDFTQDMVDVATKTHSPNVFVIFDNITYLQNNLVDAKVNLSMNMPKSEYTFKENEFTLNDFKFGFDGTMAMPTDDISMDLTFKTKETTFKSLLSLVPAIFKKDFDKVQTDGNIAFDGHVKGVYGAKSMPGYNVNLKVNNAMMKYPDLPTAVTDILIDLNVSNKDGEINNTNVDLKKFHMMMGKDPVDAKILMAGISPGKIDADVKASLNLAEIEKFYPIEGLAMKGLYNLDLKAKGTYDSTTKQMPVVNAAMSLKNGYVKSKDFPDPIENLNFHATANSDGTMPNSSVLIDHLKLVLQGEPFESSIALKNFDNINYDAKIKGVIDLTKMTKIYPIEGTTLEGKLIADFETKGIMSDVEAGKYDKTSTTGTMGVNALKYLSTDLPQGMTISNANFSFNPQKMEIQNMKGTVGKSDMNITGYVSNYMGYLFSNNKSVLEGKMNFSSNKFDVNEWMTDDTTQAPAGTPPAEEAVFEVPKDLDFLMATNIKTVLYDNMTMDNMTGNVIMKDGIARMEGLSFNTLGGKIIVSGAYNTKDLAHPLFNMDLDMQEIGFKKAYETFNTMKKFAPVAKLIDGNFSTKMKMNGELGKDMMPLYNTMTGSGALKIAEAALKGNKALAGISALTKLNDLDPLALKNILVNYHIADGKLAVDPFDIKAGQTKMNISGNQSIEGALDYVVKMDVPAGAVGSSVNGAIGKLTGGDPKGAENIKLDLKVGGTASDPKVGLLGSSVKEQAKEAVKDAVKDKVKDEIKNSAESQKAQAEIDKAKKDAEDKIRKEAEARLKAQQDSIANKAAKDAADKLKNKIKLPKF
jgi:hypothetical protein